MLKVIWENVKALVLCYQREKSLIEITRKYIDVELAEAGDAYLWYSL